jgi:hypothetical protein
MAVDSTLTLAGKKFLRPRCRLSGGQHPKVHCRHPIRHRRWNAKRRSQGNATLLHPCRTAALSNSRHSMVSTACLTAIATLSASPADKVESLTACVPRNEERNGPVHVHVGQSQRWRPNGLVGQRTQRSLSELSES